jgi:hypothetical protein
VTAGDTIQSVDFDQTNLITNAIGIVNSAELNAEQIGIQALIDNENIGSFTNNANFSNANGTAAAVVSIDSLVQSGNVTQTNAVENQINIDNAGSIDPDEGMSAKIENLSIGSFSNSISALNVNGTAAVIDGQDLTQSMTFSQANSLSNAITAANEGKIKASGTGIDLMIINQDLSFSNSANLSISNTSTTSIAGDLDQSAEVNQSNTITNAITVNNKGSIEAGGTAISAQILSGGIVFSNAVSASLSQTSGAGANGSFTQRADITQRNLIDNKINIFNSGSIEGGTLGIYASIPYASYSAT